MKFITLLLSSFCALTAASAPGRGVAFVPRGGADLGPIDSDLAIKVAKTATTAYVAGSASKLIAKNSGGQAPALADFVTTELWTTNALCSAIAFALYSLGDNGFDALKTLALANVAVLVLKLDSDGLKADTILDNKVQSVLTVLLLVLAFIK